MLKRTSAVAALLIAGLLCPRRRPCGAKRPGRSRAQARSDRLTLDLYLDMETVSEPQLSPDGDPDRLHARMDRQAERQARVGALDHERRRQPQPLPREGIRRALVAHRATASPTPLRASPRARRSSSAGWMPRARPRRSPASTRRRPRSPGRPTAGSSSFSMLVEEKNTWPIKMPKAPAGAKWTEAPRIVEQLELPARSQRLHRQRLPPRVRRAGLRRHAAADHLRQLRSHGHRLDARRQAASSSAACAARMPPTSGASRRSMPSTWPTAPSVS